MNQLQMVFNDPEWAPNDPQWSPVKQSDSMWPKWLIQVIYCDWRYQILDISGFPELFVSYSKAIAFKSCPSIINVHFLFVILDCWNTEIIHISFSLYHTLTVVETWMFCDNRSLGQHVIATYALMCALSSGKCFQHHEHVCLGTTSIKK